MNKYKNLMICKKAGDLVQAVCALMKELPDDEKFGLISQIKRCRVSILSNIAEVASRKCKNEFIHFLSISNGSTIERLNFTDNIKHKTIT